MQIFTHPLPEDPTRSFITSLRLVLRLAEHKALRQEKDKEWEKLFLKELVEYVSNLGGEVFFDVDFDDFTPEPRRFYFIWGTLKLFFPVKLAPILSFPSEFVQHNGKCLTIQDTKSNRFYMKTRLTVFKPLEDGKFEVSFPDTF
jgi:hypothetical protein|nr:MAG TPA: hypothetical protein [Caudoviricetes sp.]